MNAEIVLLFILAGFISGLVQGIINAFTRKPAQLTFHIGKMTKEEQDTAVRLIGRTMRP